MLHPYSFAGLDGDTQRSVIKYNKYKNINNEFADYCYVYFEITAADIKTRNAKVTAARTMIDLYYMNFGYPINHIAKYIQKCHHTTIISRLRSLNNRLNETNIAIFLKDNPELKKTLNRYIYGK